MKNILCFKPGVANDQTAFEPMANIYKHLEQEYKYKFTIVTDPSDTYSDTQLQTVTMNPGLKKNFGELPSIQLTSRCLRCSLPI
jgi:hypothetical protein